MRTYPILIILLLISLASCTKGPCENMCTSSEFIFLNTNGQDLFDSLSSPHINIDDFIVKNYKGKAYEPQYYQIEDTTIFDIGFWMSKYNGTATYFIFNKEHSDTLMTYFGVVGCSTYIKELYYSETLIEKNSFCTNSKPHIIVVPISE